MLEPFVKPKTKAQINPGSMSSASPPASQSVKPSPDGVLDFVNSLCARSFLT